MQEDNIEKSARRAVYLHGNECSEYEVSLYNGNLATDEEILVACGTLCAAFSQTGKEFIALLSKYIRRSEFTSKRLSDAVDYLIESHKYPCITISDVLSYDKKIKFYNYSQAWSMVEEKGMYSWSDFGTVKTKGGRVLRYLKDGIV